jgi:hypothetical protein
MDLSRTIPRVPGASDGPLLLAKRE